MPAEAIPRSAPIEARSSTLRLAAGATWSVSSSRVGATPNNTPILVRTPLYMEVYTRKRARTESGGFDNGDTSGASAQTSPQDPQFWFEDGNIILVTPHVSFKVYRGLLAEHSAVFHSMFDIAQGAQSAAEQVNGCPVVALDDSPDDLRELFRLIFPLNASPKYVYRHILLLQHVR